MICEAVETRPIRVLIAEDEPLAARRLSFLLGKIAGVEIVGHCIDGISAIDHIREILPDLVLLDIHIPGADGFEVVESLDPSWRLAVVFVTAYDRYAVQAFRANAVDYLLKPVDESDLRIAVERARAGLRVHSAAARASELQAIVDRYADSGAVCADSPGQDSEYFWIRSSGRSYRLRARAVEWIEALRDYASLHAEGRTFLIRETMSSLERRLDPRRFMRVHRSAIVNMDMISHLRTTESGAQVLVLETGGEIRIGRKYQRAVTARLKPKR